MRVSELSAAGVAARLQGSGLILRCGPFVVRIISPLPAVAEGLVLLYADHPTAPDGYFADFHLELAPPGNLRRWVRPQVRFYFDGLQPFEPLPAAHAYPLFEWSLNWCIATHAHQYLIVHAAVVERDGHALIMPGAPGSGKSTLCAGLVSRGWRLLSDELTLVDLEEGWSHPLARPLSLKNESIDVIRRFAPEAVLHRPVHDTVKGTITQMKVPAEHVQRMDEPAAPGWVVFPQYQAGVATTLTSCPKADCMLELGRNGFNYGLLGRSGFERLGALVEASDCYRLVYGDLDEAIARLGHLAPPVRSL